jgi:phage protein D
MQHDKLRIQIDGAELEDLHCDLISLEVEQDDELAGMFRMTLALLLRANGSWKFLDEGRFKLWRRVVITAGLKNDSRRLMTGYITHVRPEFGAGLEQCRLAIWGMDASVLMDRVDRLRDWPDKTDSDIATQIFLDHKLTPVVTRTAVSHKNEISTIIQRETDIQLLKRLALRNGFECFVDGDTGYFRPPVLNSPPQPVLAVQFGKQTNVNKLSLEVNALAPANVTMFQQDHTTGDLRQATADTGKQKSLGAEAPNTDLPPRVEPGTVLVAQTVTTGIAEMEVLCRALYDRGEWFVTGEGQVSANQYGTILTPRSTVTVKGIGKTHSGVYYVTHVTHRFTEKGYVQHFRIKRNALMPTGAEKFSAGTGALASLVGGL